MSQTALHSHMVGFVGGTGPATGAQQHLQWCDQACRGHPPPSSSPRVSCKSQFESQPPALPPHLLDVVMRGHSVDDAIDGEEEHRQAFDGIT